MFKAPCTYHGDVLLKGVKEMTKTTTPSKPRAKRLNWEQEFVAKYGLPEIVQVSPLFLAAVRWGKRRPVRVYSSEAEGSRA